MKSKLPLSWLAWYVRLAGIAGLFAFPAAVMPESWFIKITDELQLEAFPEVPLAFYLARHLSLMYFVIGVILVYISCHVKRLRDTIVWLAWGVVGFGACQAWIDYQAGMPGFWIVGESVTTMIGGAILVWLDRRCERREETEE